MNEEEIRRYRESIATYGVMLQDLGVVLKSVARSLTPRPVKDKMLELMDGIRAQTQQNQASGGNPGNPSNPTGTQGQICTNSSRNNGPFGLGLLRSRTPQQPPPQTEPTEEQKRQMVEQQKLKELEDKQLAVKAKKKRLDRLQGLSVDRT